MPGAGVGATTTGAASLTVFEVSSFQGWNQYSPNARPTASTAATAQTAGLRKNLVIPSHARTPAGIMAAAFADRKDPVPPASVR
ncbi:hypothetical protein GCM10009679_53890 [Saccharothrix algeriensis]